MSMSRKEMPACFFTSGSVRTRQKIQSPYCPNVVQVFWPFTTKRAPDSSSTYSAVVRSEARSEPASGSENPCDHQMSRFAVARSEEHTSELQSLMRISYAVFCLKKKNK